MVEVALSTSSSTSPQQPNQPSAARMSPPQTALIVGASRGLGLALVNELVKRGSPNVYATVRSHAKECQFLKGVKVIENVDVSKPDAGQNIVNGLSGAKVDFTVIVAGVLKPETFEEPKWEDQIAMYTICSVAPTFIASALSKGKSFAKDARLILLTSEGGSITLRTESDEGMFGHHGSKAAANMVGKLLSSSLKKEGVIVGMAHPGFLKSEMTDGMPGRDEAIEPSEAAPPFIDFFSTLSMEHTGEFWAPLGPKGIGNAEEVLGKNLPTPLQVPW